MSEEERDKFLAECKARALEYWREGNLKDAVASMLSDMNTLGPVNGYVSTLGLMYVMDFDADGVKRWIEGFR
jgi:hypothetical protein